MSALFAGFIAAILAGAMMAIVRYRNVSIIATAVGLNFVFGFVCAYLFMPTMAFNFDGIYWWGIFMMIIPTGFACFNDSSSESSFEDYFPKGIILGSILVLSIIGLVALTLATSSGMFQAERFAALIGKVEERNLAQDLAPVDVHNIRQVPSETAAINVNRIMGAEQGLGSRTTVGEKSAFILNGCFTAELLGGKVENLCFNRELVEMAPLEHSSIFTYWNNGTTPAYTLASSVNPGKFYIVTGLAKKGTTPAAAMTPANGLAKMGEATTANPTGVVIEPIKLRYLTSASFSDNLKRYIYQHGYMSTGFTEISSELDDSGRPFAVATKYDNTIGFDGGNATGVIIVDQQTGEIQDYALKDVPAWVERVQPQAFVMDQLNDWGQYSHGYWNFAKLDMQKATSGSALVEGADGNLYVYSGMTSVGNDQGTSGFMLVNTRTKETRQYKVAGATEEAARISAANGSMRNQHYHGTFPVMYNVEGVPTYFTPLMDDANLVRAFAFVNVEQHAIVGNGLTWQDALRDYHRQMVARNVAVNASDMVESAKFSATVLDATSEVTGDVLTYYFLLQGKDGVEFAAPVDKSRQLKWTKPGDTVEITAESGDNTTVMIGTFLNVSKPLLH